MAKTLADVVAEKPFPDFASWWPVGNDFIRFMANAIYPEWRALSGNDGAHDAVVRYLDDYLQTVYSRAARPGLLAGFISGESGLPVQSGEFDALSYAFTRAAFQLIAAHCEASGQSVENERRLFTQHVGRRFFSQLEQHLGLELPPTMATEEQFQALQTAIAQVGHFLSKEGYLRDHFAFTFDVHAEFNGRRIEQNGGDLLAQLACRDQAYALYEMGFPIILPSAVYLHQTIGEAQHYSSRTIEELFARVGLEARETDDFDPSGFPSDLVIELWEIRSSMEGSQMTGPN